MRRIRVLGILVGVVAGFFAGMAWSILVALLLAPSLAQTSSPAQALNSSQAFFFWGLMGSFFSSAVAGWTAAHMAKGAEIHNALVVGFVVVVVSAALFLPLKMDQLPLWYNIPAFALTVPFAWAGGRMREKLRGMGKS